MIWVAFGLVTAAFAWAVFWYGGVTDSWSVSLCLAGCAGLLFALRRGGCAMSSGLRWSLLLLPCYVAFQLLPLPAGILGLLSPQRARLLEALTAIAPASTFAPLSIMPWATFAYLLRLFAYVVVFLIIRELARSSVNPWIVAIPIIAIAALEASWGIAQYAADPLGGVSRGTYIDRNHFAGLLEMAAPFAVARLIALMRRETSFLRSGTAVSLLGAAIVIMLGLLFSLSRTGYAAAVCALGIVVVRGFGTWLPPRKIALILAGLTVASVLILPGRFVARISNFLSTPEVASQGRPAVWKETALILKDYPVFGSGLGTHPYAYFKYKNTINLWTTDFTNNDYLQLLSELGIFGFAILSAGTIALLMLSFRESSGEHDSDHALLACACAGALVAILIHSVTEFNLYIPSNAMLVAWVGGIASGMHARPILSAEDGINERLAIPEQ